MHIIADTRGADQTLQKQAQQRTINMDIKMDAQINNDLSWRFDEFFFLYWGMIQLAVRTSCTTSPHTQNRFRKFSMNIILNTV